MVKVDGEKNSMFKTATSMKGNMNSTRKQALGSSHGRVAMYIEAAIKMMKGMAMGRCTGQMDHVTRENGSTESKTALARWSSPMGVSKKASSRKTSSKGPA